MCTATPGSRKWRTSAWQELLGWTLEALDSLREPPEWSFGGGTALAVHCRHRVSYDIDVFVRDMRVIEDLRPTRNPTVKRLLGGRKFQFPGYYLKLEMEEGEIDFIAASPRTREPWTDWEFQGRVIRIETPWEIGVKKMFYRSSNFKVRDVFDLAAILDHAPDSLAAGDVDFDDRLPRLRHRLEMLVPSYEEMALAEVNPTEEGRAYMSRSAAEKVLDFVAGLETCASLSEMLEEENADGPNAKAWDPGGM